MKKVEKRSSFPVYHIEDHVPLMYDDFSMVIPDHNYAQKTDIHRHDYYEIMIVKQGSGTHYIDFHDHEIKAGRVFFLRPGQIHINKASNDTEAFYLMFQPTFYPSTEREDTISTFSFFRSFSGGPFMDMQVSDEIFALLQKMSEEIKEDLPKARRMVQAYFARFCLLLERQMEGQESELPGSDAIVKAFNVLLDDPNFLDRFVSSYASKIGVSASHLNVLVRKNTGKTASQWIKEKIVLEAKRLLKNTSYSIAKVGWSLGFEDTTYFCRFFKMHTKMSPSVFRRFGD